MGAPTGNQFWKQRSSHGRNPIFANPDDLWESCQEYFEWVDNNPLMEWKAWQYQGEVIRKAMPKMRAMTVAGLCIFLDIDQRTFADYRTKNKKGKDFSRVTTRVDAIIKTQKFEGASADLLNPNIIARDLGLGDKQILEHSGSIKQITSEMSESEAIALYQESLKESE